jgi:flap endonuclease-1
LGVKLSLLIKPKKIRLSDLYARTIVFDANNLLYQFLALVRVPDGTLLTDRKGRITSHLLGASLRITKLMSDFKVKPIMVFDGPPSVLKLKTLEERKKEREKALIEWKRSIEMGDLRRAFSKAVASSVLSKELVGDAATMFSLMGIPVAKAPEEAEAQASYMCMKNEAWAIASQDYDSLLYGSPRIVRYITIQGTDFLPSKMMIKPLIPELIDLNEVLKNLNLSREQLVDLAILIGTDFNEGIPGVGPKKAYKLIKKYGNIEMIPKEIISEKMDKLEEVREMFLSPKVTNSYSLSFSKPNFDELVKFLHERDFSEKNIKLISDRLKKFTRNRQESLRF